MRISDWSSDVCSSDLVVTALEDQLPDDLLDPGRARLGVGCDDNVVVAEPEVVPDRRIEVMIVEFPGLLRPCLHCRLHPPSARVCSCTDSGQMPSNGFAASAARSEEHTSELQSLMRI